MPKKTLTPIELAKKYLIYIGIDPKTVSLNLLPSLFEDHYFFSKQLKSNIVLSNKIGQRSNETHIYVTTKGNSLANAFFSDSDLDDYEKNPISINNKQKLTKIKIFEHNIYSSLERRNASSSPLIQKKNSYKIYKNKSNDILNSNVTTWLSKHNKYIQIQIGKKESDGDYFNDFRLGILLDDYLLLLKYRHSDCFLAISIPKEYAHKFLVKNKIKKPLSIKEITETEKNDTEYVSSSLTTVKGELTPMAPLPAPKGSKRSGSSKKKYSGKPSIGRGAIEKAKFTCENDNSHKSFISKKTGENYMEPHHLIPISQQEFFVNSIDITPNLICLCPNCHKQIHHGTDSEVKAMLKKFYTLRHSDLKRCGIEIDFNKLIAFYDI